MSPSKLQYLPALEASNPPPRQHLSLHIQGLVAVTTKTGLSRFLQKFTIKNKKLIRLEKSCIRHFIRMTAVFKVISSKEA